MRPHSLLVRIFTVGIWLAPLTLFVYHQQSMYPLVAFKTVFFQILVSILTPLWVWLMLQGPEFRPRLGALHYAIGAFLLVLIITGALAVNPTRAFWSSVDRTLGITAICCFALFTLMLQSVISRRGQWQRYSLYAFSCSAIVALTAVIQRIAPAIFFIPQGERPGGTLGNPAFLASFLILSIGLGAWLAYRAKYGDFEFEEQKKVTTKVGGLSLIAAGVIALLIIRLTHIDDLFVALALGVISYGLFLLLEKIEGRRRELYVYVILLLVLFEASIIFLSGTRGAILGLGAGGIVALAYLGYRNYKRGKNFYKNTAFLGLLLILVFSAVFYATRSAKIWQGIVGLERLTQATTADSAVNNRLLVWRVATTVIKERPLLGWGFENFRYAFDLHYNPQLFRSGTTESYWDKPHNILLEILVGAGILGLLAYLGIFGAAFYLLRKSNDPTMRPFFTAALIGYVVQNLFFFDTFGSYFMLYSLLALIIVSASQQEKSQSPGTQTPSLFAYVVLLIVAIPAVWFAWINVKIAYANTRQYNALNYFVNRLPEQGITSYREGLAVSYPYSSEIRQSFVATLKQIIPQYQIKNASAVIDFAIKEYPAAIAQDPHNHFLHYTLGDAKTAFFTIDKKYLEGAGDDITRANALSPNRQQIYYAYSRIKLLEGDRKGALAEMQKAVDLDPLSPEPLFYHALLAIDQLSDEIVAMELLQAQEYGRSPRSVAELRIIFNYFMLRDQFELGVRYFAAIKPSEQITLDTALLYGTLAYYSGNEATARVAFQQVAQSDPEFLTTERYAKEFKSLFQAVGVTH